MIAYVLPTRNRPKELAETLAALGALAPHDAEVVVVDNASSPPPSAPLRLANDIPVKLLLRDSNEGAAARNAGVQASDPGREWIVMLDDDSHPLNTDHVRLLREQPPGVVAVQAEIWLNPPSSAALAEPRREAGGLPEVFIGCGVAIRRCAFLAAGGYDPAFDYYAEEYDLAAKFIRDGGSIVMDRRFQIHHRKVASKRSMDRILRRLVRNNTWVMRRYAPDNARTAEVRRTIRRYGSIALKERAELGYLAGLFDLARTSRHQLRSPLSQEHWDRFTGKAACLATLQAAWSASRFSSASLIEPGKNRHVIEDVLRELGVTIVDARADAERIIVGTLSPGPMLDAYDLVSSAAGGWLLCPWTPLAGPTTQALAIDPARRAA